MKLSNLGMEKAQAWNAYREYQTVLGKSGNQRDRAVMAGYRALAKGKTVIDLLQVMKEAGTFESGLPRLAIMRADKTECYCRRWDSGDLQFKSSRNWYRTTWSKDIHGVCIPGKAKEGKAIVPLIPPQYRPGDSVAKKYFILWEADWEEVPKDPALLKHLSGNLYSVVAVWDLTPVEQAVLRR